MLCFFKRLIGNFRLLRLDGDEPSSSNGLIEATVRLSTWLPSIQVWIDEQQLHMGYDKLPHSRLKLDPNLTLPNTIMVTPPPICSLCHFVNVNDICQRFYTITNFR